MTRKKSKEEEDYSTLHMVSAFGNGKIRLAPLRKSYEKSAHVRKKNIKSKLNKYPTSTACMQTQNHDKNTSKPNADKPVKKRNILHTILNYENKATLWILHQIKNARGFSKSIAYKFSQSEYLTNRRIHLVLIIFIPISVVFGCSFSGILQSKETINRYGLVVQCANDDTEIKVRDSLNKTFYIKNNNKEPVILNFIIKNWDPPEAQKYIEILWNYDGSPIPPGATCKVIMMIKKLTNHEIDDFNFTIDFVSKKV